MEMVLYTGSYVGPPLPQLHMQLETDIQHNLLCKLASLAVSAGNQDVLDVVAFWMRVRHLIFYIFHASCAIPCTPCTTCCVVYDIYMDIVWCVHSLHSMRRVPS